MKRQRLESTPKQSTMIDWLTTPPFKHIQVCTEEEPSSSPTCMFDPSPVQLKTRKISGDKSTFLDLLNSIDQSVDEAKVEISRQDCPIPSNEEDYFDNFDIDVSIIDGISQQESDLVTKGYLRYLVLESERRDTEIHVRLLNEKMMYEQKMILKQDWLDTPILPGKYVHVVLDSIPQGDIVLDNQRGLLVIDPDELISVTSLADSFQCLRRSVLNWKIRFVGPATVSMVHGTLLHSLFQEALLSRKFEKAFLESKLKELIHDEMESLYMIGQTEESCFKELIKYIPMIILWYESNCTKPNKTVAKPFRIQKPIEVEERIWSPKYGVKGNIDVTVQVDYTKKHPGSKVVPLELKTGRNQSISHRAQTSIYTMMMSDRYGEHVDNGLLVYLQSGETTQVNSVVDESRSILIGRNLFAHYATSTELPPIIDNEFICTKCYCADLCMIGHKVLEGGNETTSKLPVLFTEKTSHLTETDIQFIQDWEALISVEEKNSRSSSKDIWTLEVKEREKKGSCIGGLKILMSSVVGTKGRFSNLIKFGKSSGVGSQSPTRSLVDSNFGDGDPVVVLQQNSRHPLAIGIVQTLTATTISVMVDKPIKSDGDDSITYTIDKDSFAGGLNLVRGNLYGLFLPGGARLRDLIVSLVPPTFNDVNNSLISDIQAKLNPDQRNAILRSIGCSDYSLILGMPGTGKTSTIAYLIQTLIRQGKSVLFTSYTHSAVDNLLIKLLQIQVPFLRLGSFGKMHPLVRDYTISVREKATGLSELTALYETTLVVATTALSINDAIFTSRKFDYCIIDEASQIALPVSLGPLQYASKFILVGDHYQLPPLFANQKEGSEEASSLFKHLSRAYPFAVSNLTIQYRMNKEILKLTNRLIYDNRLKCGGDQVANSKLKLPNMKQWLQKLHRIGSQGNCWLQKVINPENCVLFVDTDGIEAQESRVGPWIENKTEVSLVSQIVNGFIESGIQAEDIGVISPYKYQLKKLSSRIKIENLEISTVDKFQGKDKKVIIISLVRSNDVSKTGDLIKDWKRINVAITRAEKKLVFVGSKKTISNSKCFEDLIGLLEEEGWIVQLDQNGCCLAAQRIAVLETPVKNVEISLSKPPLKM